MNLVIDRDSSDLSSESIVQAKRPLYKKRKTLIAALSLMLVLTIVGTWLFRHTHVVRLGLLSALALVYTIAPGAAQIPDVNYGISDSYADSKGTYDKNPASTILLEGWRLDVSNEDISPMQTLFHHEKTDHPRLKEFRNLAPQIFEGSPDPFQLADRIRRLTTHDVVDKKGDNSNPLEYLKMAIRGTPLTCRYFAILHVAACSSQGYTARLLGLSANGTNYDHAVTEVYIPDLKKWVLVDTDFNSAWRLNGEWLNALDIHRYRGTERETEIELVALGQAGESLRKSNEKDRNLYLFNYVFYTHRNDYLSASYPAGHPASVRQFFLTPSGESNSQHLCPECNSVEDSEELYFSVGATSVRLRTNTEKTLDLQFSTWTPNFLRFEVSSDGQLWQPISSNTATIELDHEETHFEVRSVNERGIRGYASRVQLTPVLKSNESAGLEK